MAFSLAHLFNMFPLAGGLYSTKIAGSTKGFLQQALQACLPSPLFNRVEYSKGAKEETKWLKATCTFPIAQCQGLEKVIKPWGY